MANLQRWFTHSTLTEYTKINFNIFGKHFYLGAFLNMLCPQELRLSWHIICVQVLNKCKRRENKNKNEKAIFLNRILRSSRTSIKGVLWVFLLQCAFLGITETHTHLPECFYSQAHMEYKPPCHRPDVWTGRCRGDIPCTGWFLSQCSGLGGRGHTMSPTVQNRGHRHGMRTPPHQLH